MRILHVWNQSGVASILAKYQRKLGHTVEVVKRDGFDPYGIEQFYGTTIYRGGALGFYRYILKKARSYDVIHIHSLWKIAPLIRKPTVLHFHGSELRSMNPLALAMIKRLSAKLLVSTPDLLNLLPNAEWLPNPVDTELFRPRNPPKAKLKPPVPYRDMPSYLLQQDVYRETTHPWCVPKTALEALALNIPVEWNGLTIQPPLPSIHDPMCVARRTIRIYEMILDERHG